MITPTESFLKVQYDVRPAKQVERRMLLDTFQTLLSSGFPLRDYKYVGFGSMYFVDFILFHKILGLNKFLSVEICEDYESRVHFNKPFNNIEIEIAPISDIIPRFDNDEKYLLWLDYDIGLCRDCVNDISLATYKLSPGSIILITIDARSPENKDTPNEWYTYLKDEVGSFFDYNWTLTNFRKTNLNNIYTKILFNAINSGLHTRENVRFFPLFNFLYKDSCPMLTVGGIIGTNVEERQIRSCDFSNAKFIRDNIDDEPYAIRVPRLTRKERIFLDQNMPCRDDWKCKAFKLDGADILAYRDIYRYFPMYAEFLI